MNVITSLYRVSSAERPRSKFAPAETRETFVRATSAIDAAEVARDALAESGFKMKSALVFELREPETIGLVYEPLQPGWAFIFERGKPVGRDCWESMFAR